MPCTLIFSGSSKIKSRLYSLAFSVFGLYSGFVGYSGKLEEKLKAQDLRRQGLSYGEILQQIDVSKDTLSRWCRDIELTEVQKRRLLENKSLGQRKGSLIAADNKRRRRLERIQEIYKEAKLEIGRLNERDRFIAGLMLYAGEGEKGDRGTIGFANSDPKLIKFMVKWFEDFCNVSLSRFRGAIWLHEGHDESNAKQFWSETTGISLSQFHKTYIAKNKIGSKKIRKNIHEFGVFAIRFGDVEKHRKIMGWISAVMSDKISSVH